jgi:hypothetical protein
MIGRVVNAINAREFLIEPAALLRIDLTLPAIGDLTRIAKARKIKLPTELTIPRRPRNQVSHMNTELAQS